MIVRVVSDVGCERIHKEKKVQRVKVLFLLYQEKEKARCGEVHQPWGMGLWAFIGEWGVVRQDVSAGLQLLSMLSLGAGPSLVIVVWCVLFRKFPELLCLQDASSNFLVLRTKAHKILGLIIHYGVQQALAKRAWKGGFCSIILRSGVWDGFILNDLNLFCFWGIEMKFSSSKLLPADYGHRVVPACGSEYGSLRRRGWNWTAQKVRAVVGVFLQKESPRTWVLCWVKDIRYLRRYGLRWQ